MSKEAKERNHNCVAHCVACGEHFTGTAPFDEHRVNGECVSPAQVTFREGTKRAGQNVLDAIQGRCDKEPGCWKDGKRVRYVEPVTLWRTAVYEKDDVPDEQAFLL